MDRARAGRLAVDAGIALALAAAATAELLTAPVEHLGARSPAVGVVGVAAVSLLLAHRRARPALLPGVPLVWLVLGCVTLGELPVLFWGALVPTWLALYSAARHADALVVRATAAAATAAVLLGELFLPVLHSWNEALFDWVTCGVALLTGWGLRRAERRAVDEAVRAARAESRARERTLEAVGDERARIARELHDVLGHSMTAMVVQAGAAEQVVEDDPELVRRSLASIRDIGTASLAEVRRAVAVLGDGEVEPERAPRPGLAGLTDLVATARAGGLDVELHVRGDVSGFSPGLELAVYRIVQESLTNVRKHSGATHARVEVRRGQDAVEVVVQDDGADRATRRQRSTVGATGPAPGHGLIGMRERAHLYGGRLEAGPAPQGFAVRAVLPTGAPA
jgi:signal transduction histidine kinase